MFQKNLYSYFPLFQTLFSISTFVVQISGQGNGSPTLDESNIFIIIGLVCGCIFMVMVCVTTRCILFYYLKTKIAKPKNDSLTQSTAVSQRDSFTSEFYYNITDINHPKKQITHSRIAPPPYEPTGSIEVLRRVENEYEGLDLYARKESNDYDEIKHSQVISSGVSSSLSQDNYEGMRPSELEIVRSLTPQSNRTSPDNNKYVIDQLTPVEYEGMLPVTPVEYEGMLPVTSVEYEGMLPVATNDYEGTKTSDYVIDSLSSDVEVAYYSIQPNLEYDYITIATPQPVTKSLKPDIPPKPLCCVLQRNDT